MIEDDDTTDVAVRLDIPAIYQRKVAILANISRFDGLVLEISEQFNELGGYSPLNIDPKYGDFGERREEKCVDRVCWRYLVSLFHLERYMLCTDYKKMMDDIAESRTPTFTIDNAEGWIAGLKSLIHDNIRTLVKKVFAEITHGTYEVGGRNGTRKKRNNNGVDERFILRTVDWSTVFGYWSSTPTITDDLEKVCYLLAGRQLPEKTAKEVMRDTKSSTFEGEFFYLKFHQNGNTHYRLNAEIRQKLNLYGPAGAIIGENIKIKIMPDRWAS